MKLAPWKDVAPLMGGKIDVGQYPLIDYKPPKPPKRTYEDTDPPGFPLWWLLPMHALLLIAFLLLKSCFY